MDMLINSYANIFIIGNNLLQNYTSQELGFEKRGGA